MNSNWSYSPETAKLGCDLCDLDLWPWPFAWTLPWFVVITPENFMMIWWWEHSQKGVTDRQTDRQRDVKTENTIHRAAWSQLIITVFITSRWIWYVTIPLDNEKKKRFHGFFQSLMYHVKYAHFQNRQLSSLKIHKAVGIQSKFNMLCQYCCIYVIKLYFIHTTQ